MIANRRAMSEATLEAVRNGALRRPGEAGFTYLALLFMIAILGVGLAAAGIVWHTAQQRDRERELLFIGTQFRLALASYYRASPGIKHYPAALPDLVKDPRFPGVRRHLRRVYVDPMTGIAEWGLVRNLAGGIIGVHSLSRETPIRRVFLDGPYRDFSGKTRYADWKFVYLPTVPGAPPATPPAGAGGKPG